MNIEEIKIRQLENQHLLSPASCGAVVRDLCGVQAQYLSNAFHAIRIRSRRFQGEDAKDLMKSWTIRGTMHVFAADDLPLFLHEGRKRFLRPCDTLEGDDRVTRERKRYFADLIESSICAGMTAREELRAICLQNGMTEEEAESVFNAWGGTIRALCEAGRICYAVPEQGEKRAYRLCPPFTPMEADAARLELARRYFTFYVPATVKDAAYFFAATQTDIKQQLSRLPVSSFSCNGKTYFYIARQRNECLSMPKCLFLAGFDPLMLGYQKTESLYLPQKHLRKIFTLSGIVMPAVLLDGFVAGRWKQKGAGLAVTLFEPVPPAQKQHMEECAHALWPSLKRITFAEA